MRSPEPIKHLDMYLDLSTEKICCAQRAESQLGPGFSATTLQRGIRPSAEHFFAMKGALGMQDIFLYFASLNIEQIKGFQAQPAILFYKATYFWNLCSSEVSTCWDSSILPGSEHWSQGAKKGHKKPLKKLVTKRSCLYGVWQHCCWKIEGSTCRRTWDRFLLTLSSNNHSRASQDRAQPWTMYKSHGPCMKAIDYAHNTVPTIVHHGICPFSPLHLFPGLLFLLPVQFFSATAWSGHLSAESSLFIVQACKMCVDFKTDLFSKICWPVSFANHEILLKNESCDTLIPQLGGQGQVDPFQKHCRASDWFSSHRSKNLLSQQIISLEEIPIKAINTEHAFHLVVEMSIEALRLNTKLTTHRSLRRLESMITAHQDPYALKCCWLNLAVP